MTDSIVWLLGCLPLLLGLGLLWWEVRHARKPSAKEAAE